MIPIYMIGYEKGHLIKPTFQGEKNFFEALKPLK